MDVSRSSFYRWKRNQQTDRYCLDQVLMEAIVGLRQDRQNRCYGSRRLALALRGLGFALGRKRVSRLMREAGIIVRPWRVKPPYTIPRVQVVLVIPGGGD